MYNILNNSKSGMVSTQSNINLISNNIANVNTAGYKKLSAGFEQIIKDTLDRKSYPTNNNNAQEGNGVKLGSTQRDSSQGNLKQIGIESNLAIEGNGFFRVIDRDNQYKYTRNGEFNIDSIGRIVNDNGDILDIDFIDGQSYDNIKFNKESLTISKSGEVFNNNVLVGKINIYNSNMDNMLSVGSNLFVPRENNLVAVEKQSIIYQGYVEMSNVDLSREMTDLIMMQRSFQFNGKGISTADQMWSMINNMQAR